MNRKKYLMEEVEKAWVISKLIKEAAAAPAPVPTTPEQGKSQQRGKEASKESSKPREAGPNTHRVEPPNVKQSTK